MKTLAAIDIGTNSVRLEVVRVEPDRGGFITITQQKESVRLGENEFNRQEMTNAAIERGVLVCTKFAQMARGFGADEIVAYATAAVREAENQQEFIDRVRDKAEIDVRVISGPEEARLIYVGVSSGANLGDKKALFIDIGGGSTELILGNAEGHFFLDSLKLGSIRVSNQFLANVTGPVSPDSFQMIKQHVRAVAGHVTRSIRDSGFDLVYGSAGTITNLADVTARRLGDTPTSLRNYVVRTSDLQDTVDILCRLSLEDRRRVPGLDYDRADIIIGGAAVLMAVLEDVKADKITISDRGLRHGMLVDAARRDTQEPETPVRKRSILELCRTCNFDEAHAEHAVDLSLTLFDEAKQLGLHKYGPRERELLEYAAYVHDIGCFLSHTNHQRHAYYLVRHSDLLGFDDTEIAVIANVAYYHRKSIPKKRHTNLAGLTRQTRQLITVLSSFMRIAEGLDRSHLGFVEKIRLTAAKKPARYVLTLVSKSDCQLEIWGVRGGCDLFEQLYRRPLDIVVESPVEPPATKGRKKSSPVYA
jgi:exopolyphosphatase/guanosine-5'-triphosphate,3'-diphosphate pyrophosphatase